MAKKIDETHGNDCQVIANYTGGTKTMSVAMVLVGLLTEKWDLSLNIGPRTDLIKVKGGDVPIIIDKWRIFSQTQIESIRKSIRNFDYAYAVYAITELLQHPLDKVFRDKLIEARQLCQAFDRWDKFAHDKAFDILEIYGSRFSRYIVVLKQILGKQRDSTGYELVGDLLNNAERKAHRKYYDDAVGRIYRAMELFAQVRLKKRYGHDTSNILLTDLREDLQREYKSRIREDGKLILVLREYY
jgi:CRISPR-associated protein (TIGR02710 family)